MKMLCYYTHLSVNDTFHRDILIHLFLKWLEESKNKMYQINYQNEIPFQYSERNKEIKIEDFTDHHVLAIQFITSDNYKKNQFTVEVMYSYQQQTLDLAFYKDINNDSRYISSTNIPNIFKTLLLSPYVYNNQSLPIQVEPYFINQYQLNKIKNQKQNLPLIILYRHKKCCISPFSLSEKLLGIAHVLCVNTSKNNEIIHIIYPDQTTEQIIYNHRERSTIEEIANKMRNNMIENQKFSSFDDLQHDRLQQEHEENFTSSIEFVEYFEKEILRINEEIELLEEEFNQLSDEYDECKTYNQKLESLAKLYEKEPLILTKQADNEELFVFINEILEKNLTYLDNNDTYRKRDILQSILRRDK